MKAVLWVLVVSSSTAVVWGQGVPHEPGVWHVYSLSGTTGYYSVGLPYGYGSVPPGAAEKPAWGTGGSAAIGWAQTGERSSAALSYSASYNTQSGHTGFSALNQSLFLSWQRKLRGRWNLSLAGEGAIATRDQYLYDLYGSASLTQALYGSRVLTSQITSGLAYQQSERLSWKLILTGTRIEGLPDAGPVMPASTAISADLRPQYLLSPRTTLSFGVAEIRTISKIEDVYTTRATAGLSHALSRRWRIELHGGGSQLSPLRQTYPLPAGFGYVAGGSLEFKSFSHTLLGTMNRQQGDAYGLGAADSLTGSGTWIWRRPGNPWSAQAGFSWQRLNQGTNIEDWSASGALHRALSAHLWIEIAYVYLHFSQTPVIGILPDQSSVRVSITWFPGEVLNP